MIRALIDSGMNPTQARMYDAPLCKAMHRFDIQTVPQRAAFVAQCMHESANFTRLEESLWYSTPERITTAFKRLRGLGRDDLIALCKNPHALADAAYGSMNGNRGQLSGDGWAYRGSGPIQLTGLDNFKHAAADTGRPYVEQPDLVRTNPDDGCLVAALFWHWNGCNSTMDDGDFDGVSKIINLGNRFSKATPNGSEDRRALYARVMRAMS